MLKILPCNQFDEEQISALCLLAHEIWNEHYVPIIGKAQVDYMLNKFQSDEVVKKQLAEGFRYYMLRENEDYIGYIGLAEEKNRIYLSKLYIKSDCRGKGFGKQALAFVENLALKADLSRITLTVNKNNHNSINAYKKCGFVITEPIVQDIGNGYVMDDYIMEKPVNVED